MEQTTRPLLSIGIIFRDNIRSIERCLKALQPLRDAVPCQLVMADTGSEDGSRQVAERYADILVDFPWTNDFAAARNAALDRCTGKWYITVDTDEYLDEDIEELVNFVTHEQKGIDAATVVIRNYTTYEMDGAYSNFMALRVIRMSLGVCYQGAIHERFGLKKTGARMKSTATALMNTVFHHDGYVELGAEGGKEKRERNIKPIREMLEKDPDRLVSLLQFIESGVSEPDLDEKVQHAVELIERRHTGWEQIGPPIIRYAVGLAQGKSNFDGYVEQAENWFPNSYFTRIDVEYYAFSESWKKQDYQDCIRRGEICLDAYRDYRAGRGDITVQAQSVIAMCSPYAEQNLTLLLAEAYQKEGQSEKALELLNGLDYRAMDANQAGNFTRLLCDLHARSRLDTAAVVVKAWEGVLHDTPARRKAASQPRDVFIVEGSVKFSRGSRDDEEKREGFHRHACTVFAPLAGKCEIGTAAAIMMEENPDRIEGLLNTVNKWREFPASALSYAIRRGANFPLVGKPLALDDMDSLASRLAQDTDELLELLQGADAVDGLQGLAWARSLVLAAVQTFKWQDKRQGMVLAKEFVRVEKEFLPACYSREVLRTENIFILSQMHRFGFLCVRAFETLDAGDAVSCVRWLRKSLMACEDMEPMIKFLLENISEIQPPAPATELLELAEKVRMLLSAYAPDDPAVEMLKQSAAYQKVAHLIEGPEPGVFGGLRQ